LGIVLVEEPALNLIDPVMMLRKRILSGFFDEYAPGRVTTRSWCSRPNPSEANDESYVDGQPNARVCRDAAVGALRRINAAANGTTVVETWRFGLVIISARPTTHGGNSAAMIH